MRLLFITRKYPPAVGGMEKLSQALGQEFSKQVPTTIIAWGGSQKWLPLFLPYAFFKGIWVIYTKRITHVHLGDGLLSPLGLGLKVLTRKKISLTACGLDITFKNKFYQAVVPFCLRRMDHIISISSATEKECLMRGVPKEILTVIPCGVYPEEFKIKATRKDLEQLAGMDLKNKKVLITVGRLVERKGVAWFLENVMPKLGKEYIYLVAGDGPEKEKIQAIIQAKKLGSQVKLLGRISDSNLKTLYNTADVFVMPNIPVAGDMEGFGIVAIEASSTGLQVFASGLEGIRDAVINGENGVLVNKHQSQEWVDIITRANQLNRDKVYDFTRRRFSWSNIGMKYIEQLE